LLLWARSLTARFSSTADIVHSRGKARGQRPRPQKKSAHIAGLLMTICAAMALAQAPFEGFPSFKDVASEAGLTLMNVSGEGTNDYIIEANGNGAAFFDYDNDGDMDVLITNGSTLKRYRDGGDPVVALYENLGGGVFRNRTAEAGLNKRGWAFGVCVAD